MRLFIACALPEGYSSTLMAVQRVLDGLAVGIRLTGEEQLHLTLRFIGEAGDDAARTIAGWFKTLPGPGTETLRFLQGDYGAFASAEGLLIWSGLNPRPEVLSYVSSLEEGLRNLGFPPETRRWFPHVTLARRAFLRCPFEDIRSLLPLDPRGFTLGEPTLFKSEFTQGGMRYTPI